MPPAPPDDATTVRAGQQWWERWASTGSDRLALNRWLSGAVAAEREILAGVVRDISEKLELGGPGVRLLEVGCGNGLLLREFARDCGWCVGLDFSRGMLRRAREVDTRTGLCQGLADRLPFRDAVFDRVLCYNVFPNLPSDEYAGAVAHELVRVTRPGGIVLIGGIPNACRQAEWHEASRRFYRRRVPALARGWRNLLARGRQALFLLSRFIRRASGQAGGARLVFRAYDPAVLRSLAAGLSGRSEISPSYFIYQDPPGGRERRDLRLDLKIVRL